MTDEEILELYLNRNEKAISETTDKYSKYCKKIAFNILRNLEDVEECLNDAFLKTWNNIPPMQPNCLATYIGKIVRNLSIDKFKTYKAAKRGNGQIELALSELDECIPGNTNVEQVMEGKILSQAISRFLEQQPEEKRNIFIRRYWYLYSIKEIANIYNMNENKVTSILFRTRNELKAYLEKEGIAI